MGDLENAINEAKTLPKTIIDNNTIKNATISTATTDIGVTAVTGTTTVYRSNAITSSLTVDYSATGGYYIGNGLKYWTAAYGSTINTSSVSGDCYYQIDKYAETDLRL